METVTIDGKKFEKVEVDFDTLAVGDKVFGNDWWEIASLCKTQVWLCSGGRLLALGAATLSEKWFLLKEIKQPEIIETMWVECIKTTIHTCRGTIFLAKTSMGLGEDFREVKPIQGTNRFEVVQ